VDFGAAKGVCWPDRGPRRGEYLVLDHRWLTWEAAVGSGPASGAGCWLAYG
jgi:hypothetical protein